MSICNTKQIGYLRQCSVKEDVKSLNALTPFSSTPALCPSCTQHCTILKSPIREEDCIVILRAFPHIVKCWGGGLGGTEGSCSVICVEVRRQCSQVGSHFLPTGLGLYSGHQQVPLHVLSIRTSPRARFYLFQQLAHSKNSGSFAKLRQCHMIAPQLLHG